ncbi:MAG: cysteine desulfurase [Deltaproteobacteria bacterium]|jgi:cysteine desulfurase|nr:cysteine desulfurase [Deltaproteobacteria bacterium]
MKRIYADNSASTMVSPRALAAMLPFFSDHYANPSAIHECGGQAKKALELARRQVAASLGAMPSEIFFTSGGTESNNWAIFSAAESGSVRGRHIVSAAAEHKAILKPLERLSERGFEITLLTPDRFGRVTPESLKKAVRDDTILVTMMTANNVVGSFSDVQEYCQIVHAKKALFHTDAVQATGHLPLNVRRLGIDLMSLSAHKFHGPKGVGALFVKIPKLPFPLIDGGGQERGARSGTENVPGVVGLAEALTEAVEDLKKNRLFLTGLRDRLIQLVLAVPTAELTGDPANRLPGHASFVFAGLGHGANLVNCLNDEGISVSSGAACSAASKEGSHVLEAMNLNPDLASNALRISLSRYNTMEEVEYIAEKIGFWVPKLQAENSRRENPRFFSRQNVSSAPSEP